MYGLFRLSRLMTSQVQEIVTLVNLDVRLYRVCDDSLYEVEVQQVLT